MTNLTLQQKFESMFSEAMEHADRKAIRDVKAGRVKVEPIIIKPEVPSIDGEKIQVYWKDPEAVQNAVSNFLDLKLKKVKNGSMVREELAEKVYKGLNKAGVGEYFGVEVDLMSGAVRLLKD